VNLYESSRFVQYSKNDYTNHVQYNDEFMDVTWFKLI